MLTQDLHGIALDYAVTIAQGLDYTGPDYDNRFSADWELGGPIIQYEGISIIYRPKLRQYWATDSQEPEDETAMGFYGHTILEAAMRCYVASVLGDDVTIPDTLEVTA
jgi:hypothetical protein